MNKLMCINCGRRPALFTSPCCQSCEDAGNRMAKLLELGLSLGYVDGSFEMITSRPIKRIVRTRQRKSS